MTWDLVWVGFVVGRVEGIEQQGTVHIHTWRQRLDQIQMQGDVV